MAAYPTGEWFAYGVLGYLLLPLVSLMLRNGMWIFVAWCFSVALLLAIGSVPML